MIAVILLLAVGTVAASPRYFISTPNVLHVGVTEKISVLLTGINSPATVQVYMQDYPHKKKTFSQVQDVFNQDSPGYLSVKINPQDLQDPDSLDNQYVYLVATCNHAQLKFTKTVKILLSFRNGVILIQTDKPIYTPKETVMIRVVPLDFNLLPSTKKLTLFVKNPQGIRVQQWKDLSTDTGIITKNLELGDFIIKGNWTIEAFYDGMVVHNTSTVFEVKEYVLPKFYVEIKGNEHILPSSKKLIYHLTAKKTYGDTFNASVALKIKIVGFGLPPIVLVDSRLSLFESLTFSIRTQTIIDDHPKIWFPEGRRLQIEASVTEKATGHTERYIKDSIVFTSSPFKIKFTNTARYFRAGLPFPIKIHVVDIKDIPQAKMPVRIIPKGVKQDGSVVVIGKSALRQKDDVANKDITDNHGYADFLVDVPRDIVTIKLEAETNHPNYDDYNDAVKEFIVNKYTSTSGEYLMVRQQKPAKVGQNVFCEAFLSSRAVDRLVVMVISRGQIVYQNVYAEQLGIFKTIIFKATAVMSPLSRLVTYYTLANGEVISDTINLDIEESLPNTLTIKEEDDQDHKTPGRDHRVVLFGEKGTRVGLLAVDKSVYLLRNKNRLTPKSVFDKLKELDLGCGSGSGKDTKDVFKNAGLSVMTGSFVSDSREDFTCKYSAQSRKRRSPGPRKPSSCCLFGNSTVNITKASECVIRARKLESENEDCIIDYYLCCIKKFGKAGVDVLGRSFDNGDDFEFLFQEEAILDQAQIRTRFPEAWMKEEVIINDNADSKDCNKYLKKQSCYSTSMDFSLPHTMTKWVVQAIGVSNTSGFGIAKPSHITVRKNFFLTLDMPYSAQVGEQISILATVYNYYDERDLDIHLYVGKSDDFCSISQSEKPLTKVTKNKLRVKKGGGAVSFPITIVPIKFGSVDVKVIASYGFESDGVERTLLVMAEGIEKLRTQTFVLDPQGVLKDSKQNDEKNDVNIKNTTFKWNQILRKDLKKQIDMIEVDVPRNSVPFSISAMITFTGNLIGPVVTNLITGGLEGLLRMPTGCGEQTMIYMSPNVYVLQYLSNTKQVTASVEEKAYRFIEAGYKRELNYRRSDSSFSAWGNTRPGSTWLTAFVVKVFCEASRFDGVQIDETVMCLSIQWLIKNQRADGAFPEVHHVIHREMVGGVYQNGDIAMTAFVVTALLECKCDLKIGRAAAVKRAVKYLENNLGNMKDPYTLSVSTYALAMASSTLRFKANSKLTEKALFDSVHTSRHWNAGGHALNIETAAYALLAQLSLNRLKYAGPIVTWLSEQKNSGGGFKSTTDTCVALQALAKYSEQTAGAKLDLRVTIKPLYVPKHEVKEISLFINKDNALVQQRVDIINYIKRDDILSFFDIETTGTGVAQMQFNLKYNLPASKDELCAFKINTTVTFPTQTTSPQKMRGKSASGKKGSKKGKRKGKGRKRCKGKRRNSKRCQKKKKKNQKTPNKLTVSLCTQYKRKGKTGMAIVDVGILTGYRVDEQSLSKLMLRMNETIANYELSDRSLVFYLDSIDSAKQICIDVKMEQFVDMGAVYPVPIKVYDYYEPDVSCTKYYGLSQNNADMANCNGGKCRCTQDKCAALNPRIKNADMMVKKICREYDYAIRANLIHIDESRTWLSYHMKITEVIKQGTKKIKKNQVIEFWKRGSCISPNLKANSKDLLIMGRDKAGKYFFDKNSFVADIRRKQKNAIDKIAERIKNGECDTF